MSSNEKYCPYCGSISQTSDAFCNYCGASLDLSEPIVSSPEYQNDPFALQQESSKTTEIKKTFDKHYTIASASFILGIISVAFFLLPILDFPFQLGTGIIAIISGIIGIRIKYKRKFAIIGLILGVSGIALWVLGFLKGIFSI